MYLTIQFYSQFYLRTIKIKNIWPDTMFLGSMMAFLFCGLTMNAVGRAAAHMVDEVRRQFREIKGILTGETEPDYERCVEISTKGAQREMVVPSLIAIIAPA